MVDGLKDLLVQLSGSGRIEGDAESHERVGEALHTNTDGTVAHVRLTRLGYGIVVDVDDTVEVERDDFGDVV